MNARNLILFLTGIMLFVVNCGKKPSSEVFLKDFGTKMCYKAADCAHEKIKNIPESQRGMMMGMLPTREKCDIAMKENEKRKESGQTKKIELTAGEIELGQDCLKGMEKTSCDAMRVPASECVEFNKILTAKSK